MHKYIWYTALLTLFLATGIVNTGFAESSNSDWLRKAAEPYKGKTVYVISANNLYMQGMKEQIPDFEKITGIKVVPDVLGENIAAQKINVELAGSTGAYDAIWGMSSDYFQYAKLKWILPLDPFVKKSAITNKQILNKNDFIKSLYDAGVIDNKTYAIPSFAATTMLYYRTDVFAKLGIKGPPKTIDDIVAASKKIKSSNLDMAAIGLRGAPGSAINVWIWPSFLHAMGGDFVKHYPTNMTPTLNSPQAIKAAETYASLLKDYSIPGASTANFDEIVREFVEGRLAMMIEGAPQATKVFNPAFSKVIGKVGFGYVPSGPKGTHPGFQAQGWMIPSAAKNQEAAWLFIQWATSRDVMLKASLQTSYSAVPRLSIWNNPDFVKKYSLGGTDYLKIYLDSLKLAKLDFRPPIPEYGKVCDIVGFALNKVSVGETTAQKALSDANREIYEILKKAGYPVDKN